LGTHFRSPWNNYIIPQVPSNVKYFSKTFSTFFESFS
jgi:hypothetical protein